MLWNSCFILSAIILIIALLHARAAMKHYKSERIFTPFNTVFTGVFLAVFAGMVPIFVPLLEEESAFFLKLFVFDALQTIQVFTVNVGADLILDNISKAATEISGLYSAYMACLFIAAPVLTFGFLLSLFKNVLEELLYKLHYREDVYVFSELSAKSLVLAHSIKEDHKNALIVFTDVDREEDNILSEHIEDAKMLQAILFRKDIVTADLIKHSKKAQMNFFTIGETESDNLIQSLKLLEKYRNRENTGLYVFSSGTEGELLLANAPKGAIKVRRINEIRSLIYRFLYEEGERIFSSAVSSANTADKQINAVIVGLGKYGTEMTKALTWYSQMDGYSVTIHAFDKDKLAEEKFAALCPELMSEKYNGTRIPGESEYSIRIHANVDIRTKSFADTLASLPETSFVFVCLGDDEDNINRAADIRMLCARAGYSPVIKAVVYSTEETEALSGITNYRGQTYGIEAIGDFESAYSEENLMGSELEKLALERHLKWGQEDEFWQYEYNYRSSMAAAIHRKARISCGIPGAEKEESGLTPEEKNALEMLEHRRWNAYMRSEGYVYSGSPDKASRNDLARTHHDLIAFESLPEEDKRKDSAVGTK